MLKNILFATATLIHSCGTNEDAAKVKATNKKIEPQGFVLTTMELHADPRSCMNGQKGARAILTPLDPSKKAFSAITCYESERTKTDARTLMKRNEHTKIFATNEANSTRQFPETFEEFCQVNQINDLAAIVRLNEDSVANMQSRRGYSCKFDPEQVKAITLRNDLGPENFFDLRTLRYFPNVRKVSIETTTLAGLVDFDSVPSVTYLDISFQGMDLRREVEQLHILSRKFPSVTFLRLQPARDVRISQSIDISFAANLSSLETMIGFLSVKNVNSLKDHKSLRIVELPHAEDQFEYLPPKLEILRYEIDTTSNYNWADQKIIKIKRFDFEEAQ